MKNVTQCYLDLDTFHLIFFSYFERILLKLYSTLLALYQHNVITHFRDEERDLKELRREAIKMEVNISF